MPCDGNYGIGFIKGVTPKTDDKAKPTDWDDVVNAPVIHITSGYLRGAIFDGTFELESNENCFIQSKKGIRAVVKCYWHCRRPDTEWAHILVENAKYTIDTNYTGKVVRNLGSKNKS